MKTLNISSYEIPFCADCKMPITVDNDSGWEVFTDKSTKTQPVCIGCDFKRGLMPNNKTEDGKF